MENIELLKELEEYAVVAHYKEDGTLHEYIVVRNFNRDTKTWDSGDYFTLYNNTVAADILNASLAYDCLLYRTGYVDHTKGELEEKLRRQTIPYDRLVELATQFKDGLIEDDEEFAMEYFDQLEMTLEERQFFGIEKEYEVYEVTIEQTFSRKIKVAVPKGYGEDKAIEEANDVFSSLDFDTDNGIEWGPAQSDARYCGIEKESFLDYDIENDYDCI